MDMTEEQRKFWTFVEYFKPEEFDSPDAPGSGLLMQNEIVRALRYLRTNCNFPLVISSGYRTESHNKAVGGEANSAHTRGWAADISCGNSPDRFRILEEAFKLGFKRVGISGVFIHLDMDPSLPQSVAWIYK